MRMKAEVQSVQNAAGGGNAEKGFQVAGVIPHHGGDAIAGLQTEFGQCRGEAARTAVEFAITGARDGFVRLARDDLDPRKDFAGTLQDGGQRQRKIHHRAAHKASWAGNKVAESYHQSGAKGKGARNLRRWIRLAAAGQLQLQKRLISERLQTTAASTGSRRRQADFLTAAKGSLDLPRAPPLA